ncbi:hypothetical protein L798_02034 [Zootermopsis nevadensis]|uniref:Uncharacterized protein n=1 Tax=Zootermopsis nevadensis TaxID=136037 RepID=A0A067QSG6_ZOONE|nr:hypothetical protein L798_02034 [Zootermopsis nevadensis]
MRGLVYKLVEELCASSSAGSNTTKMSAVQLLVVLFVAATSCHDVVRVPLQQVVFRGAEKHQIIAADGTTEEVIMAPKVSR